MKGRQSPDRDRLYGRSWRKLRAVWLREHPLCAYCLEQGITTAAAVVDHIRPHDGDRTLFYDQSNWQSLCTLHHDSTKAREEAQGGIRIGCGLDGVPLARAGGGLGVPG